MSELVTGDAVVLGLRPAKLPSRALSVLIDLLVIWAAYLTLSFVLISATAGLDDAAFAAVQVALLLLVPIGGVVAMETLCRGRSLGKLICGLRVVREDGGPIRFRHALVRGALGFVEIQVSFGVIACIASLASARGRRLGDVFAGTLVVRERIPVSRPVPLPPPPPWLADRFAELDLSGVPDGLWLAVRQYLMRMRQLDPGVSGSMAERLAADVSACTGAPPPAELSPVTYLTGVMAERQARDARRAFGEPDGVAEQLTSAPAGPPDGARWGANWPDSEVPKSGGPESGDLEGGVPESGAREVARSGGGVAGGRGWVSPAGEPAGEQPWAGQTGPAGGRPEVAEPTAEPPSGAPAVGRRAGGDLRDRQPGAERSSHRSTGFAPPG